MLGPGAAVLSQRYVISGAVDESGSELARFPVVLTAAIIATAQGWQALQMSLSAISD
jgi:hypothetical protein